MGEITIALENVGKEFNGHIVLNDINATFESGNIYGVVGRNGCGKTVLFKIISNMMQPSAGTVTFNDTPIARTSNLRGNIGVVIERTEFIGSFSAVKNLKYLTSLNRNVTMDVISKYLELVGLDPKSNQRYKHYSFGMKQKLALAQALYEDPQILILDEPFNSLDTVSISAIKGLLLDAKNNGKLILLATHNQQDLDELCDVQYTISDCMLLPQ